MGVLIRIYRDEGTPLVVECMEGCLRSQVRVSGYTNFLPFSRANGFSCCPEAAGSSKPLRVALKMCQPIAGQDQPHSPGDPASPSWSRELRKKQMEAFLPSAAPQAHCYALGAQKLRPGQTPLWGARGQISSGAGILSDLLSY